MGPYVKLYNSSWADRKLLAAGCEGYTLWSKGLSYSNTYLLDGFVPEESIPLIAQGIEKPEVVVARLIKLGLWHKVEGGYSIGAEKWSQYQTTKDSIQKKREASANGTRKWRERCDTSRDDVVTCHKKNVTRHLKQENRKQKTENRNDSSPLLQNARDGGGGGGDGNTSDGVGGMPDQLLAILRELPGCARAKSETGTRLAEVIADHPSVPDTDWPRLARECRDWASTRSSLGTNSVFALSASALLREFIAKVQKPRSAAEAAAAEKSNPSAKKLTRKVRDLDGIERTYEVDSLGFIIKEPGWQTRNA